MFYRISCECGDAVTVAETLAGTRMPCHCGRMISVPSLRELRRLSDSLQEEIPPEMEVESLLLANRLPEEDCCILCGAATDHSFSPGQKDKRQNMEKTALMTCLSGFVTVVVSSLRTKWK
jgi:hypothetical protein